MECTYNGITYREGDIIEFDEPGNRRKTRVSGLVMFGKYEDNESYSDFWHMGFYVEWIDPKNNDTYTNTLPDVAGRYNGKKIGE